MISPTTMPWFRPTCESGWSCLVRIRSTYGVYHHSSGCRVEIPISSENGIPCPYPDQAQKLNVASDTEKLPSYLASLIEVRLELFEIFCQQTDWHINKQIKNNILLCVISLLSCRLLFNYCDKYLKARKPSYSWESNQCLHVSWFLYKKCSFYV